MAVTALLCACAGPSDGDGSGDQDALVDAAGGHQGETSAGTVDQASSGEPGNTVIAHHPASEAEDVLLGTVIWADMSEVLPEGATLELLEESGASVPGELHVFASTRLAFAPEERLAPGTRHTAILSTADTQYEWQFSTGDRGVQPVPVLSGHGVFAMSILTSPTLNVVSPPGGKDFLKLFWPIMFMEVTADVEQSTTQVQVRLASGDVMTTVPAQELCQPTLSLVDVPFDNPVVKSEPTPMLHMADMSRMPIGLAGMEMTMRDMQVRGVLEVDENGQWVTGVDGMLKAWVDVREMGLGNACNMMAGFVEGMICEACPEEPDVKECVFCWLTDIEGTLSENVVLMDRTIEDIEADVNCDL